MSTPLPVLARRLTAGIALVALPLGAAVGCGTATGAKKESVQSTLQKASDNLKNSSSASVTIRFNDPKGTLKKAFTSGKDPARPEQADLLLGGTITFTVDAPDGKTLGEVQKAAVPNAPLADQLKAENVAMTVQADGGSLVQIRLIGGDMYANVDINKIGDVAKKAGSTTDIGGQLDRAAAQAPAQLKPLVTDVRAGKWLKLPLAAYGDQLNALQKQSGATSSTDPQKLGMDLMKAVQPFVAVTDASSSGSSRVLDVKVQAKQAIKAALATLKSQPGLSAGLGALNTSSVDKLGDGTANGQVTLTDDHLKKITFDLQSAAALAPAGSTPAPDLTGSSVTITVDDSAGAVTVPSNVSSVDVGALVKGALAGVAQLSAGSSGTALGTPSS